MSTVILYTIDMSHVCLFHDWPCHLGMIYSGNQMMRRFLFTCSELNHIFSLSSVHPTLSTELFVLVFFVSLPGQREKSRLNFTLYCLIAIFLKEPRFFQKECAEWNWLCWFVSLPYNCQKHIWTPWAGRGSKQNIAIQCIAMNWGGLESKVKVVSVILKMQCGDMC